jgi:hypothetical protein
MPVLLDQNDTMPALGEQSRRGGTGGAAADDEHIAIRLNVGVLELRQSQNLSFEPGGPRIDPREAILERRGRKAQASRDVQ